MNRSFCKSVLLAGVMGLSSLTFAQDIVRESLPQRWLDQYAPEQLPDLKHPAYYTAVEKARAEVFRGRYKQALLSLDKIDKGDIVQIALVKAEAQAALGQGEQAVVTLSHKDVAENARAQILKARITAQLGRLDTAIAALKALVGKTPDSLHARYYLGEIAELAGDLELAKEHYAWIHKTYYDQWMGQGAKNFEDAELVTLMGRAFDRHATLNGQYAGNTALNNLLLKVFVQAYDVIDREYWPAHLAAGEFYYARSNPKDAKKELAAVLQANPNELRAILLMGLLSLEEWNFDGADKAIAAIRRVDRASVDADLLDARNLLQQRRPQDAELPINRVLAKQPKNLEALGLLAGAFALQLKEDKVQETLKAAEKIDPDNATAYLELAEQLSAMRQYPRAEKTFRIAIERAPWWLAPRNGLGLLLTQSGDEDKARTVLEAAYALDPFNYRTVNYLRLLDKMDKMERKETENFIVIYDKQEDPLIGEYFSDYLESIHKEVTGNFKHSPAVKTLIEVFPGHDAFSVRTTGSPWIGTVGASTGRVIAMVTPRKGEKTMGPYNWAQVLRHEYTHTVTLSATDNRIGHWMTEGLAVYEERIPLRWEWVPMLYNAVTKKQLFDMNQITWAFVRPKRPQDRSLAYAQSYWICRYVAEKWNHEKLLEMMALFKAGRTQEDVFVTALKLDTDTFYKDFCTWAEKEVSTWGYDAETTKKYAELSKKAEAAMKTDEKEALKLWQAALKLRPLDQLPHQRLAGLYLSREFRDVNKAMEHLKRLHAVSLHKNMFAKGIARIYEEDKQFDKAEKMALEAVYIDPYDPVAHQMLLRLHKQTGNKAGIEREERVIARLDQWIAEQKKKEEDAEKAAQ